VITVKGKYNSAKVFTDTLEEEAMRQVIELLDQEAFKNAKVRIMPDAHPGMGCVIGFTADMSEKVIPNLVGVDIGCGMIAVNIGTISFDFPALDYYIRNHIAFGKTVNRRLIYKLEQSYVDRLSKIAKMTKGDLGRFKLSIGTLGGGNHFIEINQGQDGDQWLVIHSGSRNLGQRVAIHHQNIAIDYVNGKANHIQYMIDREIENIQSSEDSINAKKRIEELETKQKLYKVPKSLAYLEGTLKDAYLDDMRFAQDYAYLNREKIAEELLKFFGKSLKFCEHFQTVHNYFDFDDHIIRKGAISAKAGEKVIIPINMRDGSILAIGKGNEDWNCSAPHGAGRLFSRTKAKEQLTMEEYEKNMHNVWSTSVKKSTLDESPMAYKSIEEILKYTDDTIEVIDIIKSVYNFKP